MRPQNMRAALFVAMAVTVALSGCGKQETKATVSSESRSQQVEPSSDQNPSNTEETEDIQDRDDEELVGIGVEKVGIDKERHLILTMKDGSVVDNGYIGGETSENERVVCFVDYDDRVLKVEVAASGGNVTPPVSPSRANYEFAGWDGTYTDVKSDSVVTATYTPKAVEGIPYTVTFRDFDGTVLKTDHVTAGRDAIPPANPTRSGYIFSGWNGDFSCIRSDTEVSAKYEEDSSDPRFVVNSISAKQGEAVAVEIQLQNNPGLTSAAIDISFADGLTLTKCEVEKESFTGQFIGPQNLPATEQVRLNWADGTKDVSEDGIFATLYFTVADDATFGSHMITVSYDEEDVFNLNGDNILVKTIDGSVYVEE